MLHSGDNVRIRRFKDLCCEYNFDSDVCHNDIAWGARRRLYAQSE